MHLEVVMASSKVRVLVVDDQVQFRTAAGFVIARTEGFELVGEARSGEESLDLIDQKHPDLVLMDIRMGAMSGSMPPDWRSPSTPG